MHGWKAPVLVTQPTLGQRIQATREETALTLKEIISDTHLGTMRPGGAANISERKLDSMVSEQRHKHPQGSMQRGNAPAPSRPTTTMAIIA